MVVDLKSCPIRKVVEKKSYCLPYDAVEKKSCGVATPSELSHEKFFAYRQSCCLPMNSEEKLRNCRMVLFLLFCLIKSCRAKKVVVC